MCETPLQLTQAWDEAEKEGWIEGIVELVTDDYRRKFSVSKRNPIEGKDQLRDYLEELFEAYSFSSRSTNKKMIYSAIDDTVTIKGEWMGDVVAHSTDEKFMMTSHWLDKRRKCEDGLWRIFESTVEF